MKKIYITIASVWALSAMNAQVLTNGSTINQLFDSNYFLDASSFQAKSDASQGKLLGFPKTDLTKFKFDLSVVSNDVTLSGFDGVIVYNTVSGTVGEHADGGYTANTMGEQVTVEPGFYYFSNPNGADNQSVTDGKWIRLSDAQANAQLWAQRQANGVTETYLKPALTNNDFVGYRNDRSFSLELGETDITTTGGYDISNIPLTRLVTSDVLNRPSDIERHHFSSDKFLINEQHVATNTVVPQYFGSIVGTSADNVTSDIKAITNAYFEGSSNTNVKYEVTGLATYSRVGDDTHSPTVGEALALRATSINNSKSTTMTAIKSQLWNRGTADHMVGILNKFSSQSKDENETYPVHIIKTIRGIDNKVTVSPNATVESIVSGITSNVGISENTTLQDHVYGKYSNLSLGENITMVADKRVYGNISGVDTKTSLPENNVHINRTYFSLQKDNINVRDVRLNDALITSPANNTSVRNMYAFSFGNGDQGNWTAEKMYGLHLDKIINGQTANYGIYMENVGNGTATDNYSIYTKAGKLRFGDLASTSATADRMVTVDNEGVLKTQDATAFVNANSEWVYDTDNNQVKLKKSGSGDFTNKVYYTVDGGYKNIDGNGQALPSFNSFTQSETTDSNSSITKNETFVLGSTINIPTSVTNNGWGDLGATSNSYSTYMDDVPDRATYYNNFGVGVYAPEALTSFKELRSLTGFSSGATTSSPAWLREIIGNSVRTQITPTGFVTLGKGQDVSLSVYSNQTMDKAEGVANALRVYSESGTVKRAIGNNTILTFQRQSGATVNTMIGNNVIFASWESSNPTIKKAVGINFQGFANGLTEINSAQPTITDFVGLQIADVSGATNSNYAIHTGLGNIRLGDLTGSNTRMVVANADGVLSTQALPTPSAPKWVEDPSTNAVTLTVNSNGSPRATNVVSVYDNGEILASGFKGTNGATIFPDYVFENYYTGTSTSKADYSFKNLDQVENFVKTNGHLPGYVSAKEIKAQGYIDIMDTQLTNVEKIEELYLHTIEQDKAIKAKDAKIAELEARLSKIEQLLNK